jgi:SHS2 domain-containing protein
VPFEWVDHTADAGIEVRGSSAEAVLERAILATAAVIVGDSPLEPLEDRAIRATGADDAERLVCLLGEVIYLHDVESFLPAEATVRLDGETVTATLRGERFDEARHWVERDLKAVTFHQAALRATTDGSWVGRVIFDL